MEKYHDSRLEFYESWIQETPQRIGPRNDHNDLVFTLKEYLELAKDPESGIGPEKHFGGDIYYLETPGNLFVYAKNENEYPIVVQFEKTPQVMKVVDTAKKESYRGMKPFTSDIYVAALGIAKSKSLSLTSDQPMTDGGLGIWKQLIKAGRTISVYDSENPGQSLKVIQSSDDLDNYFGDASKKRYRYVLSEGTRHFVATVKDHFATRRIRELAGITDDGNNETSRKWRDTFYKN